MVPIKKIMSRGIFWTISILTMLLCGLFTFINLNEFYKIGILELTANYPFGGEGPTPYYYNTSGLYAMVSLIWGLLFLSVFVYALITILKGQSKRANWLLGFVILLVVVQYLHSQIGV